MSRIAIAATLWLCCCGSFAHAGPFFWTDTDGSAGSHTLRRANADGSGVQTLVTGLYHPRGMTLDLAGGRMYWTEPGVLSIKGMNLDGSGPATVVVATDDGAAGVVVDSQAGKIYWTDSNGVAINLGQDSGRIRRANLDGTNVEDLVNTNLRHPGAIALDGQHGKVYWTNLEGNLDGMGRIQRANFDGTSVEDVVTSIDEANGLAIDPSGGKLYWPELATGKIQRSNLDGSVIEDLVVGLDTPTTIGLDLSEGKMYWTDSGNISPQINRIQRANLDGTNVEVLIAGDGFPWGIAVVPEPSSVVLGLIGASLLLAPLTRRGRKETHRVA